MDMLERVGDDVALMPRVLAHYHLVGPLIEKQFADTPVVYKNYPGGVEAQGFFHATSIPLSVRTLLWCVHAKYAVEFYTWSPLPEDEDRLRFGRILLEPPAGVSFERVKAAASSMADVLERFHVGAMPLLDGVSGIALWIPFADAPHAKPLREWLHRVCNYAAMHYPELISTEYNTHRDGRVHAHVSSNAPHRYSIAPYSLRAPHLAVCTPIYWEELDSFHRADAVHAGDVPERLKEPDVFGEAVEVMKSQRFSHAKTPGLVVMATTPEPRGHVITAAMDILEDGKPRNAKELLAEALARKLVPCTTTFKYVYTSLTEYIARQLGHGRKPAIVQDEQRRFRVNEPPDDWPDLVPLPQPVVNAEVEALCERLDATGGGKDPAAFEVAVCDAFAHLGFLTRHMGQYMQPDGVADAILGPLGYRVLLECKTAKGVVTGADPLEVAKFREPYKADLCVIVGPRFPDYTELLQELQTHRVAALAIPELQTLLHIGANALEVMRVLAPGYAFDVIADMLWEREHGIAKRVATIAELIAREGWKVQATAAAEGGAANAARLNIDAAMMLVDAALQAARSTQACARCDVEAAFAWLASPNVGAAVRDGDALVVLRSA